MFEERIDDYLLVMSCVNHKLTQDGAGVCSNQIDGEGLGLSELRSLIHGSEDNFQPFKFKQCPSV